MTVQVCLEGNLTGRAGNRPLALGPDRIGILDLAEPFAAWSGRTDVIWVAVPRSRLAHLDAQYASPGASTSSADPGWERRGWAGLRPGGG